MVSSYAVFGTLLSLLSPSMSILTLGGGDFVTHMESNKAVFVQYYAPWCGHCKKLMPTWDFLADLFEPYDGVSVVKVDCVKEKAFCDKNKKIEAYPTLVFISNGGESEEKYDGMRDLDSFAEYLSEKAGVDMPELPPIEDEGEEELQAEEQEAIDDLADIGVEPEIPGSKVVMEDIVAATKTEL